MTQQEKRIKLAEFEGWRPDLKMNDGSVHWDIFPDGRIYGLMPFGSGYLVDMLVPDYFNDLNAVHKLENILKDKQWEIYRENLRFITLGPVRMCSEFFKADVNANAFQKSQALGKTLNLW